jgi:hypothetical protein
LELSLGCSLPSCYAIESTDIDAYDFYRKGLAKVYGREANRAYLSTFRKCAALDAADFGDSLQAAEKTTTCRAQVISISLSMHGSRLAERIWNA